MAMICRALVVLIVASLSILIFASDSSSGDTYTDEYYDDEYYDDAEYGSEGSVTNANVLGIDGSIDELSEKPRERVYGFRKGVGGGLVKIKRLLVDELYVNQTADNYDCVKRVEASLVVLDLSAGEEAAAPDIAEQVNDLRKKMEEVASIAAGLADGTGTASDTKQPETTIAPNEADDTGSAATANDTSLASILVNKTEAEEADKKEAWKRLSFREKQEIRMKERREAEALRELVRPKFRLGADCESLICGACKVVVEEFGRAVESAGRDLNIAYVEEVATDLCQIKDIALRYGDLVINVCSSFEEESSGYREALIVPFEEDPDWEHASSLKTLNLKKKKICVDIGACDEEQFEFQSKAVVETQDHWDEKCFVCQAFAAELEERVQLNRHVTEGSIVPIVAQTCDRLILDDHYKEVCAPLTQGMLLDDIAWLAKVHGESVQKRARSEQAFPDKLCEEINWCTPWIDPLQLKEKQAQETMEQVFF